MYFLSRFLVFFAKNMKIGAIQVNVCEIFKWIKILWCKKPFSKIVYYNNFNVDISTRVSLNATSCSTLLCELHVASYIGEFSCIFEERPTNFVFTPIFRKNTPVIRVLTVFLTYTFQVHNKIALPDKFLKIRYRLCIWSGQQHRLKFT